MPQYEEHLLIKVAEYYHINDLTQQQIANKMNISRVKVSRMLSKAKRIGLVETRLKYPANSCVQLEKKFESIFNLKEAIIISSKYHSKDQIYNEVARFAAQYLTKSIKDGDVLGISWGKTLNKITSYLEYSGKKIEIIQMLGNIAPNDISGNEIVRKFSKAFISRYYLLPAPAIVDNKKIKEMIISDSKIIDIFKKVNNVTFAITSIGNLSKEATLVSSGYLNDDDLKILAKSKAVGDYCGIFFDINGHVCDTTVNERVIGIEFKKLKKIPNVIGIALGPEKAEAILGALRTGGINILITDDSTAIEVISKSNK
jgi:DNA-binding transcriptional regulator LsrR (DeoR family)